MSSSRQRRARRSGRAKKLSVEARKRWYVKEVEARIAADPAPFSAQYRKLANALRYTMTTPADFMAWRRAQPITPHSTAGWLRLFIAEYKAALLAKRAQFRGAVVRSIR